MQNKSLKIDAHLAKDQIAHVFNTVVVFFIIFLQFRDLLGISIKQNMPNLSHAVFLADKVFILFFALFFVCKRLCGPNRVPLKSEVILSGALIIFSIWCLLSSSINHDGLKPTVLGIFSYIVCFLSFFIFSSILYKKSWIERNYLLLLKVAWILSSVSIAQEILAHLYLPSIQWWPDINGGYVIWWRYGLFRAPSFLGHPMGIGIFALFFFTIELARIRQHMSTGNWIKIIVLGLAILFSLSRVAIGGAIIALFLILPFLRRQWPIILTCLIVCGFLGLTYFENKSIPLSVDNAIEFQDNEFNSTLTWQALTEALKKTGKGIDIPKGDTPVGSLNKLLGNPDLYKFMKIRPVETLLLIRRLDKGEHLSFLETEQLNRILIESNYPREAPKKDFDVRRYTLYKSINIFQDHPLFGVGPGMYGGRVSFECNSNIYKFYGFKKAYYDYLCNVGSIEQEWAQLLAELGFPGLIFFIVLLLTPIFILDEIRKESVKDSLMYALIVGLMVMPFQMIFYMLGVTITQTSGWLFMYFAFLGMLVGAQRRCIYEA